MGKFEETMELISNTLLDEKNFSIVFIVLTILFMVVLPIILIIIHSKPKKIEKEKLNLKKDKKFLDEYNSIISGYKTSYKEYKLSLITKIIIGIIIVSIISILGFFLFTINKNLVFTVVFFVHALFLSIVAFIIYAVYKTNKEYKLNKDNGNICEYHLIERLGKILIPNFKEMSKENIKNHTVRDIFNESEICKYNYNRFNVEDCFTFNLYNNCINLYNINVEDVSTDSDGDTTTYTIVNGVFAEITLNFSIDYFIRLQKNNFNKKEKNEILLDSSNFEKYFDVFTDNRLETTKFFDSDFMNNIIDLYNKYDIMFEFSIKNNKIYILLDEKILNSINALMKPELEETYIKYCKIKYFIDVYTLIYNKLEKL